MEKQFNMQHLHIYSKENIDALIVKRDGETKFGEHIQTISSSENITTQIKNSTANYVLIGVPEDIGVKMNRGIGGAHTAWKVALQSLCNIQENDYNQGNNLLVLGHLDFPL